MSDFVDSGVNPNLFFLGGGRLKAAGLREAHRGEGFAEVRPSSAWVKGCAPGDLYIVAFFLAGYRGKLGLGRVCSPQQVSGVMPPRFLAFYMQIRTFWCFSASFVFLRGCYLPQDR